MAGNHRLPLVRLPSPLSSTTPESSFLSEINLPLQFMTIIIMETSSQTKPRLLLDLPTEVLLHIINHLDQDSNNLRDYRNNLPTITKFRQTCRQVCDLCESRLCRKIRFADNSRSEGGILLLDAQQHRPYHVESLRAIVSPQTEDLYRSARTNFTNFTVMPSSLPHFTNLRYLDVLVMSSLTFNPRVTFKPRGLNPAPFWMLSLPD